ncbi:iron-dependent peroxidase, protein [Corynebacterium humireducens NBRC 106098 = DSM 45392]|uniref:Iron-dependent peroxidase, protein n=2 Tax=Corynebacterium humireducens TaxID=1223514 RepID=A0A0B5D345_9CORY|nr:iron-dependent peroxidase, protein [Corynebacterium humireducens NBRC 106098 = DSM 45392]
MTAAADTRLYDAIVPFDGERQAGISTPAQANLNLVGFNLVDGVDRGAVARLMRSWSEDSRRLCTGETPLGSLEPELVVAPSNLTITCGFGPRVFEVIDAVDKRPEWLQPLPEYKLDQLEDRWGQTDLVVQICSDDPIMLAHATRHLVRSGMDYARVFWMQQGFLRAYGAHKPGETPRNLFGQVDGTVNPRSEEEFNEQVWIADGAPEWMQGSTSMVVRRINMNMDTWEMLDRPSREEAMGRKLDTGAPLTGEDEFDEPDFTATDKFGLPVIDQQSHVFRAKPAEGHPEQRIKRRAYNYDIAPEPGSEQLSNSGLVFLCFQKDPLLQYDPIQKRLDEADRLNEWITHIGSAVYWIPPGTSEDGSTGDAYWAQRLLEA